MSVTDDRLPDSAAEPASTNEEEITRTAKRPGRWRIRLPFKMKIERRSGKERRRPATRAHFFYHSFLRVKHHEASIEPGSSPPEPVVPFSNDNKVNILIALHNAIRESVHQWENRIFQAFLLSAGAILSSVAFILQHPVLEYRWVAGALGIFGAASLMYLILAMKAHANNGVMLVKIEAALGLCSEGMYIKERLFVGYSGFWVMDARAPILVIIHAGTILFALYVIWVVPPKSMKTRGATSTVSVPAPWVEAQGQPRR